MMIYNVTIWCPDNCSRGKLPRLRLGFGLGLALELRLGAIFLGGNCPTTS